MHTHMCGHTIYDAEITNCTAHEEGISNKIQMKWMEKSKQEVLYNMCIYR